MARIRTIKPEICTSEQFVECSTNARLLFVLSLCFFDDGGVHAASLRRLKMEVFPGDSRDNSELQGYVNELITHGLWTEYEVDGSRYWYCNTFKKHQKIDRPNPKHPQPEPEQLSENARRVFVECSSNDHRTLDDHSPPEGKGREGKEGRESEGSASASTTRKRKRGSKFAPADWNPKPETVAKMAKQCPGVDLGAALAQLRDHEFPRAYTDWDRVYCNWIRKSAQFQRPPAAAGKSANGDAGVRIPHDVPEDCGEW